MTDFQSFKSNQVKKFWLSLAQREGSFYICGLFEGGGAQNHLILVQKSRGMSPF